MNKDKNNRAKTSRVLIVDDMLVNRMIISSLLASNGVLSDQAQSGDECLDMCERKDYEWKGKESTGGQRPQQKRTLYPPECRGCIHRD